MRQIVYNNIIELIKNNKKIQEKTKNGMKYNLVGARGDTILSLYQGKHKIKLFVNNTLFASASLKKKPWPFDQDYAHTKQLYSIKYTMEQHPVPLHIAPNFSAKYRARAGATPKQVDTLLVAWFKSHKTNEEMCKALGNGR